MTHIILNFHGVGPLTRNIDAGELNCWLDLPFFESILDLVRNRPHIQLTFDDGNASDFDFALPALRQRGLSAAFFICSGRLNQPTFLHSDQVRALQAQGMKIGSHGINHVSWRQQQPKPLQQEIEQSRHTLQQVCSAPVDLAACPFGDYNRLVLRSLRLAGYKKVFTSDGGTTDTNNWLQPRTTITRSLRLDYIQQLIEHKFSPIKQMMINLRTCIKSYR